MRYQAPTITEALRLFATPPQVALFDIDGTLASGVFIQNLFLSILSEMGLSPIDLSCELGKRSWLRASWLAEQLSTDLTTAEQLVRQFEKQFLSTPSSVFARALYSEVPEVFSKLADQGTKIGIFTLRNWRLAWHQIVQSELGKFVFSPTQIYTRLELQTPSTPALKITGSGLSKKNLDGLQDKRFQLELHLLDSPTTHKTEIAVFGDSETTDMKAADLIGLRGILISRS